MDDSPHRMVRFGWALLASLLIHLALIGDLSRLHWWPPASPNSETLPLEVRLSPVPGDLPAELPPLAAADPLPQPAPLAEEMPQAGDHTAPAEPDGGMSIELAAERPDKQRADNQEAPPLPPPVADDPGKIAQRIPPSGKLVYKFYWGKSRWLAGQAVHEWLIDGNRFSLTSTVSTSGLIGLLRPIKLVETSQGMIVDGRLRPLKFFTQWNDHPPAVGIFVWDKDTFIWSRGNASFTQPLSGNSFDKISYLYQLYIAPEMGTFLAPEITMGRRLEPYQIQNLGKEDLEIDGKIHPAIHLQRATSSADMEHVDIWLSTISNNLPVKMTYANQSGDYFEQLISLDSLPARQ